MSIARRNGNVRHWTSHMMMMMMMVQPTRKLSAPAHEPFTIMPVSVACCTSSWTSDCMLLTTDLFNVSVIVVLRKLWVRHPIKWLPICGRLQWTNMHFSCRSHLIIMLTKVGQGKSSTLQLGACGFPSWQSARSSTLSMMAEANIYLQR